MSLDPALQGDVAPDDVVFVFARALSGPPMPLAVSRIRVGDLPAQVTLDDSMAMMPTLKLSNFEAVKVTARVSKSGKPEAQPGDLTSAGTDVSLEQPVTQLELTISQRVTDP